MRFNQKRCGYLSYAYSVFYWRLIFQFLHLCFLSITEFYLYHLYVIPLLCSNTTCFEFRTSDFALLFVHACYQCCKCFLKKYWSPKFCLLRNRFVGLNAFRLAVPDFFSLIMNLVLKLRHSNFFSKSVPEVFLTLIFYSTVKRFIQVFLLFFF